jgi:large subunit ribosomal protein L7/L12
MSEAASVAFSAETKDLGDRIAGLTLKQAKELSDYLKDVYHIEPAAGGPVVAMAPVDSSGGGPAKAAEKTEFDVVLTGFGDKKTEVIKVVKSLTGQTLMEAKKLVDAAPTTLKQGASKEEAEKMKAELEKAGAAVELK